MTDHILAVIAISGNFLTHVKKKREGSQSKNKVLLLSLKIKL